MKLSPIAPAAAKEYFNKYSLYRGDFNLAIAARNDGGEVEGVIALVADGDAFKLGHIWTDGSAQVGSLLYGGAWRAAKALGYEVVWI